MSDFHPKHTIYRLRQNEQAVNILTDIGTDHSLGSSARTYQGSSLAPDPPIVTKI
jgi:hypothetical protein